MTDDFEKHADRVRKLVTLAGRTPEKPERIIAARKAVEYLERHPTPIRWLVPAGTQVRVVEIRHFSKGLTAAAPHLKKTHARGPNWFFEAQRVKDANAQEALGIGWLLFERHGFFVFVAAGEVEVHL